jgi:hypothetical protein
LLTLLDPGENGLHDRRLVSIREIAGPFPERSANHTDASQWLDETGGEEPGDGRSMPKVVDGLDLPIRVIPAKPLISAVAGQGDRHMPAHRAADGIDRK